MTPFERKFFITFYKNLAEILKNPERLLKAQINFQQRDSNQDRYRCLSLGLGEWHRDNALKFSAAVAEAIIETNYSFFHCTETQLKLIQTYADKLKQEVIPQLVKTVATDNPLAQLLAKIEQELSQLILEENSLFKNPYVLFGGVVVTAAIAAVTLSMAKP
ncbi:hypothetical protein [Legionella hackeliae]|uniref:Uncharacterized protein n=1 Tax=Legionella hackeliae TaxID=449 RepID=A0A0A8UX76_LEGHA|nr:hypothetical protein [Legionella hackeliae]KTD15263.1 hypothetical protein Lhac_0105 [Legionella hackeliae]CEK11369.1 protein of unknown function [Legionella hackeliae]STX48142.1 Uncharacterised protein [Legionella hackeliae]